MKKINLLTIATIIAFPILLFRTNPFEIIKSTLFNPIPSGISLMIPIYFCYLYIGTVVGFYITKKITGKSSFALPAFFIAYLGVILVEIGNLSGLLKTHTALIHSYLGTDFFEQALFDSTKEVSVLNYCYWFFGILVIRVVLNCVLQTPFVWSILQLDHQHQITFKQVLYSVFLTTILTVIILTILLFTLAYFNGLERASCCG